MLVCWSVGGGVGTSVVVAGLGLAAVRAGGRGLVLDFGGDQPALFGAPPPTGPGLADWLRAAPDVDAGALVRLAVELVPGLAVVPRGHGDLAPARVGVLTSGLADDDRFVVADAGCPAAGSAGERLVAEAQRTLLVTRACPLALRRIEDLVAAPTGVVVVRDRRRSVTWHDVAAASGAPVLAELEIDPAVAAAVDAGLGRRPLPRSFLRVLDGLR